jgi:hypothetical protein
MPRGRQGAITYAIAELSPEERTKLVFALIQGWVLGSVAETIEDFGLDFLADGEDDDDQDGEDEDGDEVQPMSRRAGPLANAVAYLPSSLRSKLLDAGLEAEKLAPGLTIGGSDARPPRDEIEAAKQLVEMLLRLEERWGN